MSANNAGKEVLLSALCRAEESMCLARAGHMQAVVHGSARLVLAQWREAQTVQACTVPNFPYIGIDSQAARHASENFLVHSAGM
jgi:hypothetical protein